MSRGPVPLGRLEETMSFVGCKSCWCAQLRREICLKPLSLYEFQSEGSVGDSTLNKDSLMLFDLVGTAS